ncbi:MAG: hypothetical protein ACRD9W_00045 [Terriglobia bacterium]
MQAPNPSIVTLLVLAPLLVWRIYSRIRRLVGRQRLTRLRPMIALIVFPAVVLSLAYAAHAHAEQLLSLAGGLGLGLLLGVYGLRLTRFESTPQGLFYTPRAQIGIALSLLFVGRILYRLVQIYALNTAPAGPSAFGRNPLTLAVVGLLAGYYTAYAGGLLRWRSGVLRLESAHAPDPPNA